MKKAKKMFLVLAKIVVFVCKQKQWLCQQLKCIDLYML